MISETLPLPCCLRHTAPSRSLNYVKGFATSFISSTRTVPLRHAAGAQASGKAPNRAAMIRCGARQRIRTAYLAVKMKRGGSVHQPELTMLVSHEREKLINAIIYFAENTRFLGKTKLCKLLYFLDFDHFKETGRSVTGMNYYAWKMGPVPVDLYEEVDMPEPDLADKVAFLETATRNGTMLVVKPVAEFDDSYFTKREMRIMRALSEEFRDSRADDMIEATHLENRPWHKVYIEDGKRQQQIPYELALRRQEAEAMQEVIAERQAFVAHFRQP